MPVRHYGVPDGGSADRRAKDNGVSSFLALIEGHLTARNELTMYVLTGAPSAAQRLRDAFQDMPGVGLFAVTALTYFAITQYVIWLNDPVEVGAGFWPAAGVTVALLLLVPTGSWLWILSGIILAESLSDLVQGYPTGAIPWWTAGNVVEPLLGAWLVRRVGSPRGELVPLRNLLLFIAFAVVVGPLVGGTIGSVGTVSQTDLGWAEVWPRYVVGDALGVLVVAPVILTLTAPSGRRLPEASVLAGGLVLSSIAMFWAWPGSLELVAASFTIPFLTWAAVRFGMPGAAWSVFVLAEVANLANAFGYGPFADLASSPNEAVVVLQVFLLVAASSAFVLAALVHELSDREDVERVLRDLADTMPQLVWVAADDGTVDYYNQRRLDYFDSETGGDDWAWEDLIHPDDQELAQFTFHSAREGDGVYECELRFRMADGSYRWHLSRAERLESVGARQWYGTSTDIHEMKLVDQLKDEFIAIASHELRNPVAAIHGLAQQLHRARGRGQLTPERIETYAQGLVDSTSYLARLTEDLMDVSRIQRDALPLHLEPTDIGELIRAVASAQDWTAGRVQTRIEGDLGRPLLDRVRTRQILSNLIDNALKYSPEGSNVDVRARPSKGGVLIEIADHGIGLSSDELERIFTPFGRGGNVGSVAGLGLGLFVAREIAERQGGRIWAASEGEERGTTMGLWFPVDSTLAHDLRAATPERA